MQRSKWNLAKLVKIEVETLPLVRRDSACAFGEVVLEVQEIIEEAFKWVKLADVYAVSELVEKFDEGSKSFDSGFNFRPEDIDVVFALDLLKSIRIGFGAMGAAEVDATGARRSARGTSKRAARDFL
jgi:hypothetical protein